MKLRTQRIKTGSRASVAFGIPAAHQAEYAELVRKHPDGPFDVEISIPKRPRTTGENSQNHALNGIIQKIAHETGNDFADVKLYVKRAAFGRGLPFLTRADGSVVCSIIDGEPLPISESDMSTVECGYCIDEATILASELGVYIGKD
jgi:hypothetical protein